MFLPPHRPSWRTASGEVRDHVSGLSSILPLYHAIDVFLWSQKPFMTGIAWLLTCGRGVIDQLCCFFPPTLLSFFRKPHATRRPFFFLWPKSTQTFVRLLPPFVRARRRLLFFATEVALLQLASSDLFWRLRRELRRPLNLTFLSLC